MKIAHINNIAGIASILSTQQNNMGHNSDVFVFDGITHRLFGGRKITYRFPVTKWLFFNSLKKYDIWHYHYPYGKLKEELENRKQGKIFIKHYHGDDLRGYEERDQCFVSTPDLLKWAPNARWLPNPIDIAEIESQYLNSERIRTQKEGSLLKVGYYPFFKYNRHFRQDFIRKALFNLQEKRKIIPIEIFGLNHTDALFKITECDIIVGKIVPEIGWYGQFEVESVVLRKPVICHISNELYHRYSPPFYNTSRETFVTDLEKLIDDIDTRKTLANEGINYVKRYHDISKVMPILEEYYARHSR